MSVKLPKCDKDAQRLTWSRIRFGSLVGTVGGMFLTLLVGSWNAFQGGAPVAHYGITFDTLAFIYIVGGATAGTIVGILRPIAQSYTGAIMVGIIAVIPCYFGAAIAMFGSPWRWDDASWFAAIICPILVGSALGDKWWMSQDHKPSMRTTKPYTLSADTAQKKFRFWK